MNGILMSDQIIGRENCLLHGSPVDGLIKLH